MANFITLIRLILVFIVILLALYGKPQEQLMAIPLLILAIILDGIDGMIARVRQEVTLFGAVFDIAADRVIEMSLWILFIRLNLVSIWIGLVFVARGILVDSLRNQQNVRGQSPFSIMKSTLGKFLVASRIMRFLYGAMKLLTFSWLLFLLPFPSLFPLEWSWYYGDLLRIGNVLVYVTLVFCLLRGIPVICEAVLIK